MDKDQIVLLDILSLLESLSIYYVVLRKKPQCSSRYRLCWLLGMTALYMACLMYMDIYHVQSILFEVVLFFLIRYLYNVSVLETIKIWLLSELILFFMESPLQGIFIVFGLQDDIGTKLLISSIFSIAMVWVYYFIAGRKFRDEIYQLPRFIWVIISGLMFLVMLMISFFCYLLEQIPHCLQTALGAVIMFFGVFGVCGLILAMLYYFNGTEKYRIQTEIAEHYNEQQKEYFKNLLNKEQDTRQFRHDMLAHLVAIEDLLDKGNDERAKGYVKELSLDLESISTKNYSVGNDIVDTIINYYFMPVRNQCHVVVKGCMGDNSIISQKDLCIVVSNLVKNAVEAVIKQSNDNRCITFFVNEGEHYLNMRVENTYLGGNPLERNGMFTTKSDKRNHGFGIRNIQSVVKKYGGKYNVDVQEGIYITEIYIKK